MNATSPYWNDFEFNEKKPIRLYTNTLGFRQTIPWYEPVTVGALYTGSGPVAGRREMVTTAFGEYFAVDNKVPSSGGVLLIDPRKPIYQFSRSDFVYKL